jgi:hypothetical protein
MQPRENCFRHKVIFGQTSFVTVLWSKRFEEGSPRQEPLSSGHEYRCHLRLAAGKA